MSDGRVRERDVHKLVLLEPIENGGVDDDVNQTTTEMTDVEYEKVEPRMRGGRVRDVRCFQPGSCSEGEDCT